MNLASSGVMTQIWFKYLFRDRCTFVPEFRLMTSRELTSGYVDTEHLRMALMLLLWCKYIYPLRILAFYENQDGRCPPYWSCWGVMGPPKKAH